MTDTVGDDSVDTVATAVTVAPVAMARVSAIGLMSGTSVDGVDGVLVTLGVGNSPGATVPGASPDSSISPDSPVGISIESTVHLDFPAAVRDQINALIARPAAADIDSVGRLHTQLGRLYAQAANRLKQAAGEPAPAVIGCHGQTIRHGPDGEFPFTWQLGNGAEVAHLTGLPVVADFRAADLAAGGQGAPLAPAFHHAVFADAGESRAVVNLGGIANITHLPAADAKTPVTGFDTGPANTLLDDFCRRHFDAPFDDRGAHAGAGTVNRRLLEALLADPYFARPPPKSCGREHFNRDWLARIIDAEREFSALPPADVLATLTMLTAATVGDQLKRLKPAVARVYVCGGGARNRTLRAMLGARAGLDIADTAALGIAPQWVEACAFAWLALQTMRRAPATLPSVTGASKPSIAGAVYFPD
ncbi:MAG: anhydro-N-acetylmuramic acid kinase [Gammaproteobacteria bacterium]|nr:anhydro-N-acetylmuramic acid kinase [Gammaproteobacteria bacterium]